MSTQVCIKSSNRSLSKISPEKLLKKSKKLNSRMGTTLSILSVQRRHWKREQIKNRGEREGRDWRRENWGGKKQRKRKDEEAGEGRVKESRCLNFYVDKNWAKLYDSYYQVSDRPIEGSLSSSLS